MKNVAVVGSTGSIGVNTLQVIKEHQDKFSVYALAVHSNIDLLLEQVSQFNPKLVVVFDEQKCDEFVSRLSAQQKEGLVIQSGNEGIEACVTASEVDQVMLALTGAQGLSPLISAIEAKKHIALANKEPLVMAGELIQQLVKENQVDLIPVDSEHSGIFQCLNGGSKREVSRAFLTASGGPFLSRDINTFETITPEEAVKHPKWSMGKKISVDSATLMNKGLEVIEAKNLFGLSMDQIHVLIHPEALVHALIEFVDGSQLAQLAVTDMKLPIQYALSFPERITMKNLKLDLVEAKQLQFKAVDPKRFPCLDLAYQAGNLGGTAPCVLNASNEVCVDNFLKGKILFTEIHELIEKTLEEHTVIEQPNRDQILEMDQWARTITQEAIQKVPGTFLKN